MHEHRGQVCNQNVCTCVIAWGVGYICLYRLVQKCCGQVPKRLYFRYTVERDEGGVPVPKLSEVIVDRTDARF